MKKHVNEFGVPLEDVELPTNVEASEHYSRGVLISGVLDGIAAYETCTGVTDGDSGSLETDIDYDPRSDQRLDKFDALEEGYRQVDEYDKVSKPLTAKDSEEK